MPISAVTGPRLRWMHLLYVDESGKSGPLDFSQAYYVLGGLIVHETKWRAMEADLNGRIDILVKPPRPEDWELHGVQLHHGKGRFKSTGRGVRRQLTEAVFDVLDAHRPTLLMVAIHKKRHREKYGSNAQPVEELAYRFMIERFNTYVGRQPDKIGAVVCDEQKQLEARTRRAHSRYRREGTGPTAIEHVIETPFFTPSHWSRMLQIVDVATYWVARSASGGKRREEAAPYWQRVVVHLDCYPKHLGKGLKIFPS